jgi:hypothetical protein
MPPIRNIVSKADRMQSVELPNLYLAAIDPPPQVKPAYRNVRGAGCIAIHGLFDTVAANVEACSARAVVRAAARTVVLGRTAHDTAPVASAGACSTFRPPGIAGESSRAVTVSACLLAFGQSERPTRSPFARVAR